MFFGKKNIYYSRSLVGFTVFKIKCLILSKKVRRTFLFTSSKGSLTLEAALVLPLYLFFLITILYILNILHIENIFKSTMEETARNINSYAYTTELFKELTYEEKNTVGTDNSEFIINLAKNQISSFNIKNIFLSENIKNIADSSYIKNGYKGIVFTVGNNDLTDYIDFNISYQIKIPFLPDNVFYIPITQRCYFKPFVGVDISDKTGDFTEYVYITVTGTVYHTTPYCTYLNKYYDIIPESELNVSWDTAQGYHPCPHCAYNQPIGPTSFLCPGRKVYHNRTDCAYIETVIYKVPKDQIGNLPLCSRCKKALPGN